MWDCGNEIGRSRNKTVPEYLYYTSEIDVIIHSKTLFNCLKRLYATYINKIRAIVNRIKYFQLDYFKLLYTINNLTLLRE